MTKVSELLALKIENSILKLQNLQQTHQQITAEQQAFIEQARTEVGAPPDHVYDVQARLFKSPNGPKPLSAEQRRQRKRVA